MRFIVIAPFWLGLMSSCLAAPSQVIIDFQDDAGQYSFNYKEPLSSRFESRSADGMTRGIYSYVDSNGNLQTSEYEAGSDLGFNVKATNLPQAPLPIQETPEILAARQKHLQLLEKANKQEESERALQGINQSLLKTPLALSSEEIKKSDEVPLALPKFNEQTGKKEGPLKVLNQPLENKPMENLRSNVPTQGAQIISDVKNFVFPEPEKNQIIDFPDGHARGAGFLPIPKRSAESKGNNNLLSLLKSDGNSNLFPQGHINSLPLPKGDGNLNPFLQGNINPLPLPKGGVNFNPFPQGSINFMPLPKGDDNSNPFPQGNINFMPLPRGDGNFNPFPQENIKSLPLPKSDATFRPLLKGDANLNPFLENNFLSLPRIDTNTMSSTKGDANFNPYLKAHTDFMSLPKIDTSALPLPNMLPLPKDQPNFPSDLKSNANSPKSDANLLPLPKSDAPSSIPVILPQRIPEQRIVEPLPEQVKDTAEVAAARDAHLRTVAEAAAKSAIPVKDTPEVMAAREAHLRMAAQPGLAIMPVVFPRYTPEVQAAREAHFRAYHLAAKLAAESDINPRILEQLLGRPGEPKLGPQRIEGLAPVLLMDRPAVELNRPMGLPNPAMTLELSVTGTDAPMESSTLSSDNRGIENLAEKPQLKEAMKSPESNLRLGTDLICGTALKVKDVNDVKPMEDQRLITIKSGDLAPFVSTAPLPIDQSERWKNWGFQYMSL